MYDSINYWKERLDHPASLWSGVFEDKAIQADAIVVAPTMLHSYLNVEIMGHVVYPTPKSVLGFLQYVYLPTAFQSVFSCDMSKRYFVARKLTRFFTYKRKEHPRIKEKIDQMEKFYDEIDELWDKSDETIVKELIKWTEAFNENWLDIVGLSFSLRVFSSPKNFLEETISLYEEKGDIALLEDGVGLSKQALLALGERELYVNQEKQQTFKHIMEQRLELLA